MARKPAHPEPVLTPAQQRELSRRVRILSLWDDVRADAKRRREPIAMAVDRFLRSLRAGGERPLTRSTLYNWDRAYISDGVRGLIDLRDRRFAARPAAFLDRVLSLRKADRQGRRELSIDCCFYLASREFPPEQRCTLREAKRYVKRRMAEGG